MNFEFSEEQEALRTQLRRLLDEHRASPRQVMERGAAYDRELWASLVDMGLAAAAIDERHDGLGLGALELCVAAEETGRRLAPVPFASSVLRATEALKLAGGAIADEWLPKLANASVIGTLAFVEGHGSWDAKPAAYVRNGRLSGDKALVADPIADFAIVSAVAEEDGTGWGWWLTDLRDAGVERKPIDTIDCLRSHARLCFDVAPVIRLGEPGEGATLTAKLMDIVAVYTAFEQIGAAQMLLETCVDYAKTRRAFGNFIGANQAVKHRLADMYTRIELARAHCYYGAWALANGSAELPLAAAGARLAATAACSFAAEEAIELHGGIGFTWENDCHLYYRRARLLALELGNRSRWSDRLVAALRQRAAA